MWKTPAMGCLLAAAVLVSSCGSPVPPADGGSPSTTFRPTTQPSALQKDEPVASTTPPEPIDRRLDRITVAAVGDWYADDAEKEHHVQDAVQTRDAIIEASPTVLIGLGDFSYENSSPEGFLRFIEPLDATIPIYPTYGNHDGIREGVITRPGFYRRLREAFADGREWYSFDVGPIHFISINSEYSEGTTEHDAQLEFVSADLAAAAADDSVAMIIPFFHRAMANPISPDGPDRTLQEVFFPLLDTYRTKIPLALQAHHHIYSRTHVISYSTERDRDHCRNSEDGMMCEAVYSLVDEGTGTDPTVYRGGEGIVFATVGTGGAYPTGLTPDASYMAIRVKPVSSKEDQPGAGTFGFLYLEVDRRSVAGEFRANNGEILDRFVIEMP